MSLTAVEPTPVHRATLHRTACCSALLQLLFRVHSLLQTGHLFTQQEKTDLLRQKRTLINHIHNVCHSCRHAFTNLPEASPPSSLSPPSLSWAELTPALNSLTQSYGENA